MAGNIITSNKSVYKSSGSSGQSFQNLVHEVTGSIYFPLDGMLVHHRVTPSGKFTSTHLWVKRGTGSVKCVAQEHNAVPQPRLDAGLLD